MADSLLFIVWVWLAAQVPLALFVGAFIKSGREPDPIDREVNLDSGTVGVA